MNILNKNMETKRKKIGLALGSGSLKGIAHIGVLKVLEENQIPIDFISGSSIGALIGGIYAINKDIKQLEEIALSADYKTLVGLVDPTLNGGIIKGNKISEFLKQYIDNKNFEDTKIPFVVVATNFKTGEPEIINEDKLVAAIRASISVPFVFQPVRKNGKFLVDGGMTMPVPIKAVKQIGAKSVIAVNLNASYHQRDSKLNMAEISTESIRIMLHQLSKRDILEADVVIEPDLNRFGFLDSIKQREKILKIGEEATRQKLNLIKKLLS